MKSKTWIAGWLAIVSCLLAAIVVFVCKIDPYFHYHKPDTENYYYILYNQRSQNDGISRHFDYDAIITGTSMTENFKTTELDEIFGVNSIKIPYAGATYKEINDNLKIALKANSNVKMIVRGLDPDMFFDSADRMRIELGNYPTYLYDNNPFNDVFYLFNKDIIFSHSYRMEKDKNSDTFKPGITSFNEYARWQQLYPYGFKAVLPYGVPSFSRGNPVSLSEEDKKMIHENITKNVTSLADEYPEVDFYYFFTPYSVLWYMNKVEDGQIYRHIEAEKYIIELILEHDNIRLYSIGAEKDIVVDINNYKDSAHYGGWINSYLLRCMYNDTFRITKSNYEGYINRELELLTGFDYSGLNNQTDYPNDYYPAAIMNQTIWNLPPVDILDKHIDSIELSSAEIIEDQYENSKGILCTGTLQREPNSETDISDYLLNTEYIGAKIQVKNIGNHNYLVFYGKKLSEHGQPTVVVFDENDNVIGKIAHSYSELDNEWHQYLIDLSDIQGDITIYFNGGYTDNTGSPSSEFVFSNIILY